MKKQKTFIYKDELTDDFGTTVKRHKPLPKDYRYSMNIFTRISSFILYRLIARPFAYLYMKIKFGLRIKNKAILRRHIGGVLIFSNHTLLCGDAFLPNLLSVGRRNFTVTGSDASSLTPLLWIMKCVGNIPLGTDIRQSREMMRALKAELDRGNTVTVFPEAHVWPYYRGVRRFSADCARFSSLLSVPVFSLTVCYSKRRFFKTPRVTAYLDGPFYPDMTLPSSQRCEELRDRIYLAMLRRTDEYSTYSPYTYEKQKEKEVEQTHSGS